MKNEVLKKKILDVIRKYPIASLATVKEGKPWARYISIDADDDLNLVVSSSAQSRKIDQIKQNNNVHIVFGADSQDMKKPFINVEATAEICVDIKTKRRFWQEAFIDFFTGPEDPNYAIIKISPSRIEYYGSYEQEPEVYSCGGQG